MSRMAARDFEDLLQCAIPCFDRLFPEEVDTEIRQLLFRAAEWHALAKLRMHTDSSVTLLHNATVRLGVALRHFRDVICPKFDTVETPSEVLKRQRAVARAEAEGRTSSLAATTGRRPRAYNLNTPKVHFLGDYVPQIEWVGTSDSYTSENVSSLLVSRAAADIRVSANVSIGRRRIASSALRRRISLCRW